MKRCKQLASSLAKEEEAQTQQVTPAVTCITNIPPPPPHTFYYYLPELVMVTWAILMAMAMAGEGAGREGGSSKKGAPQQLCQARSIACGTEKGGILNRLLNMRLAITY